MVNVLLLEIGDKVVVNKNKEGEIIGFYEIALSKKSCFGINDCCPGIYRNPVLARVKMKKGGIIDVYFNHLEVINSREYNERIKVSGRCRRRLIRKFPETLFCEGDEVQIKSKSSEKILNLIREVIEGHRYRKPQMSRLGIDTGKEPELSLDIFFISSVNYRLSGLNVGSSYIYKISDSPDNFHWHVTVEENDLELLERGNIWEVYHKK